MKHFKEYLDEKGKLQEKPIVDPKADTTVAPPKAPQTPDTQGKNWKALVPLAGKPNDYAPATSTSKQQKYEKGLSNDGDTKLIYEPDTEKVGKTLPSWPKTKSEEFIQNTKDLSLGEFAALISQENKSTDKFPLGTIKKANELISNNPKFMEVFVREVKRNGAFDLLIKEVFKHYETLVEMAYLMSKDETICNQLAKAFNENEMLETTDVPAEEEIVTRKDLDKKSKDLPKGKSTKSIDGQEMPNMNGVVSTKDKLPENNLINAFLLKLKNKEQLIELLNSKTN